MSNVSSNPILLVFGPTASGKTDFAIDLAKRFDGEIINADSMQIYDGLPILTALPDVSQRVGIPHHLFATIEADQHWSVGDWLIAASALIAEITTRNKRPILVGGTGLYFDALTKGLAKIPAISQQTQMKIAELVDAEGLRVIRKKLGLVDPVAANKIQGEDKQRLIRALSVFEETGKTLTSFQANTKPVLKPEQWFGQVLLPRRELLYERINQRFEQMIEEGAIDEVKAFRQRWKNQTLALHKAIGYLPLCKYLDEEISLAEAKELSKRDVRRYAKRQMTWVRGRASFWDIVDPLQKGSGNEYN